MQVNVDTQQLSAARLALSEFSESMSGIAAKADKKAESILDSCKQDIEATNAKRELAEEKINKLESEIKACDEKEESLKEQLSGLDTRAIQCVREADALDEPIAGCRAQLADLEAQGADTDGGEGQRMAEQLREQICMLKSRQQGLYDESSECEQKKDEVNSRISSVQSKRAQDEDELAIQKKHFDALSTKFDRLRSEAERVDSELDRYVDAVKKFESSAESRAASGMTSIERCIALIDEYTAVKL